MALLVLPPLLLLLLAASLPHQVAAASGSGSGSGSGSSATVGQTQWPPADAASPRSRPEGELGPEVAPAPSRAAAGLDGWLSGLIKRHLLEREAHSSQEHERAQAAAAELAKVYRVLSFAGRLAHKLEPTGASEAEQLGALSLARSSSQQSAGGAKAVSLSAAAISGLASSLRQPTSAKLVARLAKKTDWNALFVKLAKVFLQYFLDLILNDMFGTTGE